MSFVKLNLVLKTDRQTDRQTDRPTDRRTDQPKYRSDLPSLKKIILHFTFSDVFSPTSAQQTPPEDIYSQ